MIEFIIPGDPQGKARPRVTVRGGYAHAYTPEKTAQYEEHIRQCYWHKYRDAYKYVDKPVRVEIIAYFSVPKNASKAVREKMLNGIIRPTKIPDLDNIGKIVLDGLQGICFENDSAVVDLHVEKFYSDVARLLVRVRESAGENSP
jgi:Holliday junction resolvase RusA-like endonuclease